MYPATVNTVIVSMGLGIWVEVNALVVNSEDLYQFRLGQSCVVLYMVAKEMVGNSPFSS